MRMGTGIEDDRGRSFALEAHKAVVGVSRVRLSCCVVGVVTLLASASAGVAVGGVQHEPRLASSLVLDGVSCSSARACAAVGQIGRVPATEIWNGRRWRSAPVPVPHHTATGGFGSVSCVRGGCVAVGLISHKLFSGYPVFGRWNGSRWRLAPIRRFISSTPGSPASSFDAIACSSLRGCTAVGARGPRGIVAGPVTPIIARWNGRHWRAQRLPTLPFDRGFGLLTGISCPSSAMCMAVGVSALVGKPAPMPWSVAVPFAAVWNGRKWSLMRLAEPAPSTTYVSGPAVSCVSKASCTVVSRDFAESWNGHRWLAWQISAPTPGGEAQLNAVSCSSSHACVAVGQSTRYLSNGIELTALLVRWNGTRWRVTTTVRRGAALTGVACTKRDSCSVTGYYYPGDRPLLRSPLSDPARR